MSLASTLFDAPFVSDNDDAAPSTNNVWPRHSTTLPVPLRPAEPSEPELRERLHALVLTNLSFLVTRARETAAMRIAPRATRAELFEGIPVLFEQLIAELRPSPSREKNRPATGEGSALLQTALGISQVIHDYVEVHGAVIELIAEADPPVGRAEFRLLERCLAEAVARVEGAYARQLERLTMRGAFESTSGVTLELRRRLSLALLAISVLKQEDILCGGPGLCLQRNLEAMREPLQRACDHSAPI